MEIDEAGGPHIFLDLLYHSEKFLKPEPVGDTMPISLSKKDTEKVTQMVAKLSKEEHDKLSKNFERESRCFCMVLRRHA